MSESDGDNFERPTYPDGTPVSYSRRHGPATLEYWSTGEVWVGRNVLFPDGSRGDVSYVLDHGQRRAGPGNPRWIYGKIETTEDEAWFVDGKQPGPYDPARGPYAGDSLQEPSLELDFLADRLFRERLKSDDFANAVVCVLSNSRFEKQGCADTWECSEKQAAYLVAGLRGLAESYRDFYLLAMEDDFFFDDDCLIEVDRHLARLGWRQQ